MSGRTGSKALWMVAAAVALVTFLVYLPALRNEFVFWDDNLYVVENPYLRSLDAGFLRWAFFDYYAANWHPLTWISHALDYAIWGLNPAGHHASAIILHAVNSLVIVLLVQRLLLAAKGVAKETGSLQWLTERSALVAAGVTAVLFGLHPVHVESVAWVAERKDLLCALFFMLSIYVYAHHATDPLLGGSREVELSRMFQGRYFLALGLFALALLSKPMAVTLPVVLLILDWYPFGRIRSLKTLVPACVEKVPFFALSLFSSLVTIEAQRAWKAMDAIKDASLPERLLVAAKALALYPWKIIYPLELVPFYPYPGRISILNPEFALPVALLIAATAACLLAAKRQRLWAALGGYYLVTLLPVLGIVQVGAQSMADRYNYLPSLGTFLCLGLAAGWAYQKKFQQQPMRYAAGKGSIAFSLVVCAFLSWLTVNQTAVWSNTITLWSYVIEKDPARVPTAYNNRGVALAKMGEFQRALADYDKAVAQAPDYAEAYHNRALILGNLGQTDRAIADLDMAISIDPTCADFYNYRGLAFDVAGQHQRALADFDRAISLRPSYALAFYNRGISLAKQGVMERALADFDRAIALDPNQAEAYNFRGLAFSYLGEHERALSDFDRAIALNPSYAEAHENRGHSLVQLGQAGR